MRNKLLTILEIARLLLLAPVLVAIPMIQHCFMAVICVKDGSPLAARKYRNLALKELPTVVSLWSVYLAVILLLIIIARFL